MLWRQPKHVYAVLDYYRRYRHLPDTRILNLYRALGFVGKLTNRVIPAEAGIQEPPDYGGSIGLVDPGLRRGDFSHKVRNDVCHCERSEAISSGATLPNN